jgi:DNA-binding beta-propeller fold protein YncE
MPRTALFLAGLLLLQAPSARAEVPPGFALKWGGLGTSSGRFHVPAGIATDLSGHVYVADFNNHRVQKFTNDGVWLTSWGSLGKLDGQLESPSAIAVDKLGHVYVADSYNYRICKFTDSGTFLLSWGSFGNEPGRFRFPAAVALDGNGDVYVVDVSTCSVQKFTNEGTFLAMWGGEGSGNGELQNPTGIAVDASGRVYVVDPGNHRISVFTRDGAFLTAWGTPGAGDGQFLYPLGIDVDGNGRILVTDIQAHRVSRFTPDGTYLTSWGAFGVGDGWFDSPFDVALDDHDRVFVADTYHNLIQKFDPLIPPPAPRPEWPGKLVLHLTSPVSKNECANGLLTDCRNAVTSGGLSTPDGPWYFAWLLAVRGNISSLSGIQFGITYDQGGANDASNSRAIDIFSWTLCGDREFPSPPGDPPGAPQWPGPGSGTIITWNYLTNCQFGDLAVAGYFYLGAYSPDVLRLTERPIDNLAAVADCVPVAWPLEAGDLGFVTFSPGAMPGCNPCLMDCVSPTRIQGTTWSSIKALFH